MNQRFKSLLLLLLMLGMAALALYALRIREPRYRGRSLSRWLADLDGESAETRVRAAEAVRQMGSKTLPFIVARLRQQDSPLKLKVEKLLAHLPLFKFDSVSPGECHRRALMACDALGPAAKDALPTLEELLHTKQPAPDLLYVMARIGPDAMPALTKASTNENKAIRLSALVCLDLHRSHSEILFLPSGSSPDASDFKRRISIYHLKVVRASLRDFQAERLKSAPGSGFPDARPMPVLPPDFKSRAPS